MVGTLLAPTPNYKTQNADAAGDAFGGAKGASTVRRPEKLPEGQIFLHGTVTDPNVKNEVNGALGEIETLMKSQAYQDSSNVLHEAAQLRVKQLFEFLHPPPVED